jgi:hypothetical protein
MLNRIVDFSLQNRFLVIILFVLLVGLGIRTMFVTPIDAFPVKTNGKPARPNAEGGQAGSPGAPQCLPLRGADRGNGFTFLFEGRNKRPPADPVNALLSFTYALLVKDCFSACLTVGLDPYLGFYHQTKYGRPALALDLMEEFRPIIADSVVITLINNKVVDEKDFLANKAPAT